MGVTYGAGSANPNQYISSVNIVTKSNITKKRNSEENSKRKVLKQMAKSKAQIS